MKRAIFLAGLALALSVNSLHAGVTGNYIEARTCDVWTGPCFANAEMNFTGKHAVLGWQIDKGTFDDVKLDGLGIVAVIETHDTLGLKQTGKGKAVLIVDKRADAAQHKALVKLAKKQGGALLENVVHVTVDVVKFDVCPCDENGCAKLSAGGARIETRCLHATHDKVCGNECAFFPPLAGGVKVKPAMAVEHSYSGKGVNETWSETGRRGAYLGSFEAR